MQTIGNDTWPAASNWLEQIGYRVTFRVQNWTEGLVSCPGERWIGRGGSEREVLEDILAQMLPSRAARLALPEWVTDDRPPDPEALLGTAGLATVEETGLANAEASDAEPASSCLDAPQDHTSIAPVSEATDGAGDNPVVELPAAEEQPADTTADAVATPVAPPRVWLTVDQAIEALEPILDRIEAERPELGLATPERQRLVILSWICRARAVEEASDDARPIVNRVAAIAKDLTTLCKVYWPGSVLGLQLNATPGKACRDVGDGNTGGTPVTWSAAADLADRALADLVEKEAKAGRDEYGWSDAVALQPAPLDPEAELAALRARIEKVMGRVDDPPPKNPAASIRTPGPKELAQFVEWGRLARWLRGAVVDFDTWARVAGRLRWLASRIQEKDPHLARILEPSFRPPTGWAASLGRDPVEQRRKKERATLYRRLPGLSVGDGAGMLTWLREALELLDRDALARAVVPFRDIVLALRIEDFKDRRHRRRLRGVQDILRGGPAGPAQTNGDEECEVLPDDANGCIDGSDGSPDSLADDAQAVDPGAALFARVRPHTEGRNAVFVSNRLDPDLEDMLRETLGFATIDWCEGTPRRVQSVEERIGQRAFDFVLAATGFQSHNVDGALYRACKKAGVPYVRVNKGRPVACAAAIAQRLALAPG